MDDSPATDRLLDAVERLCANVAPGDVTVRDIAAEAGLSVGLLYHYYDDRDSLMGAALDRMAVRLAEGAEVSGSPEAVLAELRLRLQQMPAFARIVASLILEGRDVSAAMTGHPLIARVVSKATEDGREDPSTLGGTTALLSLAEAFFGPAVNNAIGRSPDDARLATALGRAVREQESATTD